MAYFCTDYLAMWVQRSPVEWLIKDPLYHFIHIYLPSTEDHNKKLNSSKKIKLWKLSGETIQCSADKEVISTVYKVLTALFQLRLSIVLSFCQHNVLYRSTSYILYLQVESPPFLSSKFSGISILDFDNCSHSLP